MATKSKSASRNTLFCSFCAKSQHEVTKLIVGPNVFICSECTALCMDIVCDGNPEPLNNLIKKYKKELRIEQETFDELNIKPRFSRVRFETRSNHCFYLCPFKEPFDTIYSDHSKPAAESVGFTVERADDIFGTEPIIEDIWRAINSAEIVIADVTGRNPNVMYEIGMAHTVGRPVVIITQNMDDVPFDLKHYRCIVYTHTPRGCKELETKLSGTLQFLKGKAS